MTHKTIHVPQMRTDADHPTLCLIAPPADGSRGNPMINCTYLKGHDGLHSWETK